MKGTHVTNQTNQLKIFDVNQNDFVDTENKEWQSFFEDQKEYLSIFTKISLTRDTFFGNIYIVHNINFDQENIDLDQIIRKSINLNPISKGEYKGNSIDNISFIIFYKCFFISQNLALQNLSEFILYFSNCEFLNCLDVKCSNILNIIGYYILNFKNCYWRTNNKSEIITLQAETELSNNKKINFNIINPFIDHNKLPHEEHKTAPILSIKDSSNIILNIYFTNDYQELRNSLSLLKRDTTDSLDIIHMNSQENTYSNDISIFNNKYRSIDIRCSDLRGCIQIVSSNKVRLYIEGKLRKLESFNSEFRSISLKKCKFKSIPYFSDDCIIQKEVKIDSQTFKNIEDIGKELEYSRLAEFLNRSKAYIEAQKLHKHYLQAKEKNETQLKLLVRFYNFINGCGTSLLKPIIGILICWLFTFLIFFLSDSDLYFLFQESGIILYKKVSVFYSIKQAFLVTVPLLATIEKPDISLLSFGWQMVLYGLMVISYLLSFLVILQIRKLLKLKE